MKIDIGSFGYNFKNEVGENPSWGTSVGQSEMLGHKITRQGKESLALGFLYRAIDVSKVETESSKGGGRNEENPIVAAALFDKVFVNGKRIEDCEYIITLKKQIGDTYVGQHFGRLTLKYAPTIAYDGKTYNEDIFDKINSAMGWSPDWTWFASDISVISQDELHFRIHCFGKKVVFVDANDKRAQTEALMASDGVVFLEEDSPIYQVDKVEPKSSNEEYADVLRDLEIRCGSKWEAVRLFGAIYYEHVDSARFKEIRDKITYFHDSHKGVISDSQPKTRIIHRRIY